MKIIAYNEDGSVTLSQGDRVETLAAGADVDAAAAGFFVAEVPDSVTPRQGRLALHGAGLLDQVKTTVAAADEAVQIWFDYATIWERANPIVNQLGASLGLTSDQIDALFVTAAGL